MSYSAFWAPTELGKTTTVRMITGLIKPDASRASIMGYDVEKDALNAKQVTRVLPETSNVYIDLSAWQNLMLLGSRAYGRVQRFLLGGVSEDVVRNAKCPVMIAR